MIGKRVVLDLPHDEPVRTDHRTTFHSGEEGIVVSRHPRWDAWCVRVRDVTAVFFPDEIREAS